MIRIHIAIVNVIDTQISGIFRFLLVDLLKIC